MVTTQRIYFWLWNSSGVLNNFGFLELQTCNPYGIDMIKNISEMTP